MDLTDITTNYDLWLDNYSNDDERFEYYEMLIKKYYCQKGINYALSSELQHYRIAKIVKLLLENGAEIENKDKVIENISINFHIGFHHRRYISNFKEHIDLIEILVKYGCTYDTNNLETFCTEYNFNNQIITHLLNTIYVERFQHEEQLKILKNELLDEIYKPEGIGAIAAKKHFESMIKDNNDK